MPKNGANPSERPDGKHKGIAITLHSEQELQMRRLCAKTGMSLASVRQVLETSPAVMGAVTDSLKKLHNQWLDAQAKAGDIFAPEKEGNGA